MGERSTPHIWHGEAQFSLFGPYMEALRGLDTLMRLSESPQYWAMCCLHKHRPTITLASNNVFIGISGMPNATTNNSLSKICNPKWLIRQPPSSKNAGDCCPNPLRIDAPVCYVWWHYSWSFVFNCTMLLCVAARYNRCSWSTMWKMKALLLLRNLCAAVIQRI